MEKKKPYDELGRYLCAAYKAYIGGIGIDYALKTYVQNKILPTFWLDVAEMIVQDMTGQQNSDVDQLIDSMKERIDSLGKREPYDLKPLSSMTDNDIEKLVETLPEGCDVCGNPPPEMVIWLLRELRNLLPATFTPQPKGSIQ